MENITNVSCTNIYTGIGFTYMLLPYMLSVIRHDKDCEQTWYNESMNVLSDGQQFLNQTGLIYSVTSENITLFKCMNLQCHVNCDGSGQKFRHFYQVTDDFSRDKEKQYSTSSVGIAVGGLTVVLLLVLIGCWCYLKQSKDSGGVRANGSRNEVV